MKILVFADLHTPCIDIIQNIDFSCYRYDACFTLGDIDVSTLKAIKNTVNSEVYAVLGNHDVNGMLDELDVKHIDQNKIEIGGLSFVGLSGSSRFKDGDYYPMLSQSESVAISKKLPGADILISHDSAYGLYGSKSDHTHCGLKGISRYIKKNKPIINLHGHHHVNTIKFYKGTTDICVYGCSLMDVNTNSVTEIIRIF